MEYNQFQVMLMIKLNIQTELFLWIFNEIRFYHLF